VSEYVFRGARLLGGKAGDIHVRGGRIAAVGGSIDAGGARVVDVAGLIALPGLVDPHTHLREPGAEDAETVLTGSQAAAAGGYTCVNAMANTTPVQDSAGVVEQVKHLGELAGYCDVRPVGAVSEGLEGRHLAELGAMANSGAQVRFFSDDGRCVWDPVLMRRALEYVKAFDGVVAQHAQDPRLTEGAQMHEGDVSAELGLGGWPAVAEESIVARDCLLAKHVGSRVHILHVSTAGSVDLVRWAKSQGVRVTAEATPHHLSLDHSEARSYDPRFKVNPPLRTREDVEALRQGVADGTIDVVGTDHAAESVTGFFTKFGDGGADILPLSGLNKRQNQLLLRVLGASERLWAKPPTADLLDGVPGRTDEDELGITYPQIDDYLEGKEIDPAVAEKLETIYLRSRHKRTVPVGIADTWWHVN